MIKRNMIVTPIFLLTLGTSLLLAEDPLPLAAKSGQCFTKTFFPPKYTKTLKTTSTKRVKLNESTIKYKVIPAKYSWYQERVKISDGTEKIITTPAVYKTVLEKVLISPSKKVWKRGSRKAFNSCIEAASKSGMNTQNVAAGTCYYEHFSPEQYTNINQKILTADASEKIIAIPAQYKTVIKKVMTENRTTKLIAQPIKYKKVHEKVVVAPARSEWRKTTCNNRGCNQSEVVCLVEVPQTYKMVTKKVILAPAVAKKIEISPIYKDVPVQELVSPATTKVLVVPAQYKLISKRQKIQDAQYSWSDASQKNAKSRIYNECDKICLVQTPAQYKTISRKVLVTPASSKKVVTPPQYTIVKMKRIEKEEEFKTVSVPSEYLEVSVERERTRGYSKWMPMVCESNMTPNFIKKIQQALKFQGFYNGTIDGKWDLEEKNAIRAYQRAKGLSVTRLSIETMKSLGIY
jgi:hypothetical protein